MKSDIIKYAEENGYKKLKLIYVDMYKAMEFPQNINALYKKWIANEEFTEGDSIDVNIYDIGKICYNFSIEGTIDEVEDDLNTLVGFGYYNIWDVVEKSDIIDGLHNKGNLEVIPMDALVIINKNKPLNPYCNIKNVKGTVLKNEYNCTKTYTLSELGLRLPSEEFNC